MAAFTTWIAILAKLAEGSRRYGLNSVLSFFLTATPLIVT
jgi:hypothetical protein